MSDLTTTLRLLITGDSKGAQSALGDLSGTAESSSKRLGGSMQKAGRAITFGFTAPVIAGLAFAAKAAAEEEQEMAILAKTIENNTGATQENIDATEDWITAQQNATGIADGELRPALGNLVAATKDVGKSQELLAIAMDISTAKGVPLETVTKALSRAYLGQTGGLGRLGLATKDAGGAALSFDQIMQDAVKTYGGSAATAADTTAGKMNILKAQFADLTENIGTAVLPVLTKLVGGLTGVIGAVNGMPAPLRNTVVGLTAFAAISGPVLWGLGSMIKSVDTIKEAAKGLASIPGKLSRVGESIGRVNSPLQTTNTRLGQQPRLFKTAAGSAAAYAGSIAAISVALVIAIDKFNEMRDAQAQAEQARADAQSNEEKALARIKAKYGENSEQYRKMTEAVAESNRILAEDYKNQLSGVAGYLQSIADGIKDAAWLGSLYKAVAGSAFAGAAKIADSIGFGGAQAAGGDYLVTKPTMFLAGEKGAERATFTPQGKAMPSGGSTIVVNIGELYGTDSAAATAFANKVARIVVNQQRMAMATGF